MKEMPDGISLNGQRLGGRVQRGNQADSSPGEQTEPLASVAGGNWSISSARRMPAMAD